MLTEKEAVAAVDKALGESFHDRGLRATEGPGQQLWSVGMVGANGWTVPGASWLVGPDGKVFEISSNRGVHDLDLAVVLLDRMYRDGTAHLVDPVAFTDRLRVVTRQRQALADEVLRDASEGALQAKKPRRSRFLGRPR